MRHIVDFLSLVDFNLLDPAKSGEMAKEVWYTFWYTALGITVFHMFIREHYSLLIILNSFFWNWLFINAIFSTLLIHFGFFVLLSFAYIIYLIIARVILFDNGSSIFPMSETLTYIAKINETKNTKLQNYKKYLYGNN
jgi:hypothetical protein